MQVLDVMSGSKSDMCWVVQAMESCYAAAEEAINKQAVRALAALAPPHWTPAVIGTAAAIVAGAAKPLCAQQIIAQVCCVAYCIGKVVLCVEWHICQCAV